MGLNSSVLGGLNEFEYGGGRFYEMDCQQPLVGYE